MGLPLFVEPVESDLPAKTAIKKDATSPTRSGIRRLPHVSRDRRARREARIHNAIRHLGTAGDGQSEWGGPLFASAGPGAVRVSTQLRETPAGRVGVHSPWARSPPPSDSSHPNSWDVESRPLREALRDMSRSDDRRRTRMEEHIHSFFGMGAPWHLPSRRPSPGGGGRQDVDTNMSTTQPQPAARPPRTVRAAGGVPRIDRSPEREDPGYFRNSAPSNRMPDELSTTNDHLSRAASPSATTTQGGRRERHGGANSSVANRRGLLSRRTQAVDGLGDRDRSVSPEVWDTLLTTLTPDPQPPSASSSFASAAASHSAGASSNTTPPALGPGEAGAADAGCENSDGEEQAFEDVPLEAILSGAALSRGSGGNPPDGAPDGRDAPSQRDGWVGHLSVGAADDGPGAERTRRNREGSVPSAGRNASGGEEEWSGMQRIVRSMALREDIPDEWWAEAGLSRTLPRDDAN